MLRGRRGIALAAGLLCLSLGCKKEESAPPPDPAATAPAEGEGEGDLDDEDAEESPYLDVSNFNDGVEQHHDEIVACYQATAGKEADAPTGRVKTTLVIDGDGGVKKITFDAQRSTLQHPALDKCIEEKVAAWRFNISLTGGETPMPYTFDLTPGALLPE